MSAPVRWGDEFLVNTTTTDNQSDPTITALADGRFLVAWRDQSKTDGDTSGTAVRAQVFDAHGTKSGNEFLVNTTATNGQFQASVTALADGRFVAAWTDGSQSGGDTSGTAVRAQIFDVDGGKFGSELLVNTTTANAQDTPTITALADGRFVIAWTDASQSGDDTSSLAVRGQIFNANGSKSGDEFLVNTTPTDAQETPTIAALADGRFVVAWRDDSQTGGDSSNSAVRAQIFSGNGSKLGGQFLVNTATNNAQDSPTITALANGGFVIAWTDKSQSSDDASSFAVRGQVFNADGIKVGGELLVNTTTANAQQLPTISALADGRFVVAWMDASQTGGDSSSSAVPAQVFSANGSKSGDEFLVNATTADSQSFPTITTLADGRFVVAWSDSSESGDDSSGDAVRSQIFDPRLEGVSLKGTGLADDWVGTRFKDVMKGKGGADLLDGGAGKDKLIGGKGPDGLIGGKGTDRFIFKSIKDFYEEAPRHHPRLQPQAGRPDRPVRHRRREGRPRRQIHLHR